MIFVLTFLNFAFGTHSNGICLDSRHLVLGLRVQSTSVYCYVSLFSSSISYLRSLVDLVLYQVLLLQSRTQSLAMKGSKDIMATK